MFANEFFIGTVITGEKGRLKHSKASADKKDRQASIMVEVEDTNTMKVAK